MNDRTPNASQEALVFTPGSGVKAGGNPYVGVAGSRNIAGTIKRKKKSLDSPSSVGSRLSNSRSALNSNLSAMAQDKHSKFESVFAK